MNRGVPFIWLGAGRAQKRGVGLKGRLLDKAAKAGLPVPAGALLLDEFYRLALREGVIVRQNDRIHVPDPDWLCQVFYRDLRFPRLENPVAVRAAFSADSADTAVAAVLNVNLNDPAQLAAALREVWSSALPHEGDFRRDVLILEMVAAEAGGVAWNRPADENDVVTLKSGTTEQLQLPRLRGWQRPSADLPPFARRLQQLLRGVRRTFGDKAWRLKWADDGHICWLIRLYPHD